MTVCLSKDEQLTDWMIRQVKERCRDRYRLIHFADDTGLKYNQLWRFVNGYQVNQQFINDLFKNLVH
jgi:hypothetical protein